MRYEHVVDIERLVDGGYGSGYLVSSKAVLTARHVVMSGKESVSATGGQFRVREAGLSGKKNWRSACLAWISVSKDVAILHLEEPVEARAATQFGSIERNNKTLGCQAIGFPRATAREGIDDTHQLVGQILPGSLVRADLLDVAVESPAPADPEGWDGFSGAALFVEKYIRWGSGELSPRVHR